MPEDAHTTATAPGAAPLAGKTAGVIGGGPAGMLCAAHLARLGAAVAVFERTEASAAGAVWSISLGRCAKEAIEAAGLSSDFGPELRCVCMHACRRETPGGNAAGAASAAFACYRLHAGVHC